MRIHARKVSGRLAIVSKHIDQPSNEHTLTCCVSKGFDQIPSEPIDLIDAIVAHTELSREQDESTLEKQFANSCCLLVKLRFLAFKFLNFSNELDSFQVLKVEFFFNNNVIEEFERVPHGPE
jgi:hypothetical protein